MRLARVLVMSLLVAAPASAQFASEQDRREAIQHYREGQEFMSGEQFEKAAGAFQKAIERDRLLTLAHYGLGQANMALKRYASAIQAFTGCREAFRELHTLQQVDRASVERQREDEIRELRDAVRRYRSGQVRTGGPLAAERIESRIDELERQRTGPTTGFQPPAEVSLALGSAYFRSGDRESAEREWRAAAAANPTMGEAYNNLAVICLQTGRLDEAEDFVKRAERARFKVHPGLKSDIKAANRQR